METIVIPSVRNMVDKEQAHLDYMLACADMLPDNATIGAFVSKSSMMLEHLKTRLAEYCDYVDKHKAAGDLGVRP